MSAIHFWGTQPWRHESIICWLNFLALTCKWSIHNCMWRQNEYTQHTSWSFRVTFSSNALTTVTLSFLTLSNSFERFSTSCDSISFCWRSNDISWDSSCSLSLTEASWPTKLSILVCSSLLAEDVRSSRSERFSHSEVNRVTSAWRCDNNRSSSVRSAPGISGGGCSSHARGVVIFRGVQFSKISRIMVCSRNLSSRKFVFSTSGRLSLRILNSRNLYSAEKTSSGI